MQTSAPGLPAQSHAANGVTLVVVADDRLTATLTLREDNSAGARVPLAEIVQAMSATKLTVPPPEELAKLFGDADPVWITNPIIVAQGKPAIDDTPARIELLIAESADTKSKTGFYNCHHYLTAAAGQNIARVIPRVSGSDGTDVFGHTLTRKHPADEFHGLGENVAMGSDGSMVVAKIDGRLRLERGKIWVEPLMDVPGNVDFSVGNIDFAGDVHVRKNVIDLFQVRSKGNVTIDGAVEAAEVSAGMDLIVRGGVLGKEKGHCSAGRNLTVKYATNVTLTAGGDIHAHVEIAGSRVRCGGLLDIHEGSIIGGTIQARGGAKCGTLGSPAATTTVLEIGTDPILRESIVAQFRVFQALQKQIHALAQELAPYVHNQKSLSAQQRKKATELLLKTNEAKTKASKIVRDMHAAMDAARAAAKEEVVVGKTLYPGVTIRFAEVESIIEQAMRGPMKLVPRTFKTGVTVCAVTENGFILPLPSRPVRDVAMHAAMHAIKMIPAEKEKPAPGGA